MNLLVVDWDFFFPIDEVAMDWGHREAPIFLDMVWGSRAAYFVLKDEPLPGTSGEERTFWSRVKLTRSAVVHYAESNVQALSLALSRRVRRGDAVYLFDAHHDTGYGRMKPGEFTCENWMIPYITKGCDVRMIYPAWKWPVALDLEPEPMLPLDRSGDTGAVPPVTFGAVFVCRSGAWVPPWLDDAFMAFLTASGKKVAPIGGGLYSREWGESHIQAARQDAAIMGKFQQEARRNRT